MKKSRSAQSSTPAAHAQFDVTHLVLILVVGLFFGFLGFQFGKSSTSPTLTLSTSEATTAMKDGGALMKTSGAMMSDKGTRYKDTELTTKGEELQARGTQMLDKANDMLGNLGQ